MFMDFPAIAEDINQGLFSVEAQKISVDERSSRADVLIGRLMEMQRKLKQARCYEQVHSA